MGPYPASAAGRAAEIASKMGQACLGCERQLQESIGVINLNTATAADLDAVDPLSGHGFEIVRYREERGGFDAVRQLEEVPGLAGKWNGAETLVTV